MRKRITKVMVTMRIDYEFDIDETETHESFREDHVVQNQERNETDADLMGRAAIVLEFMKARLS